MTNVNTLNAILLYIIKECLFKHAYSITRYLYTQDNHLNVREKKYNHVYNGTQHQILSMHVHVESLVLAAAIADKKLDSAADFFCVPPGS